MLLSEMYNRVILESGQFQLPDQKQELTLELFKNVVKLTLGIYNKHVPETKRLYKELNGSRQFIFTEQNTPEGIPDWLSDVNPIRIMGTYPYVLSEDFLNPKNYLEVKKQYPWVYRKPQLTIPVTGDFDILACYYHKITENTDGNSEVTTINDEDSVFFKLLTGKFLTALGRARRSFRLDGLPIADDGDSLVSEGKELEEKALEQLHSDKQKWYLAWGG